MPYPPEAICPETQASTFALPAQRFSASSFDTFGAVHFLSALWFVAAFETAMPNEMNDTSSSTAPMPNAAHVAPVILPPRGFMQCFTDTTESPSIAATSTERAPPASSTWSAIGLNAGWALAANGDGPLGRMPGGATIPGIPGGGATDDAAKLGAATAATGAGIVGAAIGGGTDDGAGRGLDATTPPCSCGCCWTRVGISSSSSAPPTATSMRMSPISTVSPDCSLALLTFCPLTNVPRVDPRSMMLTSAGPVTSMTACMRLTLSSSSRRCDEGTLPTLMTGRVSFSSRRNASPL